ncbi:LysR family transcriptional regulator (plasmid) [Sinorhizobium meliloti]|nr:LysR family transcriptional regulator [Sinorhizobium meliloti]
MEIRELEAFLAVMSTGSITAAARLLDRSQSQVTRLIQDLEISVGFALFDRNGPKIAPSEKGIAFHAEAERFLSGIGHLRERARTIAEKEPQPIEIVAIPAFASGIIPLALAALPEKLLPRKNPSAQPAGRGGGAIGIGPHGRFLRHVSAGRPAGTGSARGVSGTLRCRRGGR